MEKRIRELYENMVKENGDKICQKLNGEILMVLLEKKKEMEMRKYEIQINSEIEKLAVFVDEKNVAEWKEQLQKFLEKAQNAAFMEGYIYAVKILWESIGKKI